MKKVVLISLGVCLAFILPAVIYISTLPDERLHVYFLNVGQGDAVLIQQGRTQVLIDGGPSPEALMLELGRIMPFWDRYIEVVISTHPHEDHLSGLVEVIRRYGVGQILESPPGAADGEENNLALYAEWRRLIGKRALPVIQAQSYQQLRLEDTVIDILNPSPIPLSSTGSDIDNNAVALRISRGVISFLMTADMSLEGEWELSMERRVSGTTVLKAGHHGSLSSSSADFLDVIKPGIVVISVGENSYGHPHPDVLTRLEEMVGTENIYRTDRDGTLEFVTDGEGLWLNSSARR
jgi:competence protein ComEC